MFYVYLIQNKLNNKLYIGKTNNLTRRWSEHKKVAFGGKEKYGRGFRAIHCALSKYGADNFIFFDIERFDNEVDSYDAEKFWIEFFGSNKKQLGYNETSGGEGLGSGVSHPLYGTHPTKETREKLRAAQKRRVPVLGRKHSIETKKQYSIDRSGEKNAMFGKKQTGVAKLKISMAKLGKSNSMKGTKKTYEQRKIISENVLKSLSKLKGEDRPNAKLSNVQAAEIRHIFKNKTKSPKEICQIYNISKPTLYRIIGFKTYKID